MPKFLLLTLFRIYQDIRSKDLHTEVCQVLNGYKQVCVACCALLSWIPYLHLYIFDKSGFSNNKITSFQMLGDGAWGQFVSALEPQVTERLKRYQV